MPNYKIIASDLDGTLLNTQMQVSKENLDAIQKMTDMGIYFVPSSGRTLTEMPKEVMDITSARYIIHSDGAVVYDRKTNKNLSSCCMDKQHSKEILDILNSYQTLLTVRNKGMSYVDSKKHDWDIYDSYRLTGNYKKFIYEKNRPVDNYDEFCYSLDEIEMICVFFSYDDELAQCRQRILDLGEYQVASSERYNLEIFSKDAGKGNALLRLAAILGVDPKETIGVGDSINDMDNLKKAGLSLAMENAQVELKSIADRVICNNDEHAMEYILKNIIK